MVGLFESTTNTQVCIGPCGRLVPDLASIHSRSTMTALQIQTNCLDAMEQLVRSSSQVCKT
eukprot:1096620-Rhodomonas_salina.5